MEEEGHDEAVELMGKYDAEDYNCGMSTFVLLEMDRKLCVFPP